MLEANLGFSPIPPDRGRVSRTRLEMDTRPSWQVLSADIFPEGSFGRANFPRFLDGRRRSSYVLDRPMSELIFSTRRGAQNPWEGVSVREMLQRPEGEVTSSSVAARNLKFYLRNLAISPATVLATRITRQQLMPATTPTGEQYIERTIDNLLESVEQGTEAYERFEQGLRSRNSRLLSGHFGLKTGIPVTFEALGPLYGLSPSRVRDLVELHIGATRSMSALVSDLKDLITR